MEEKNCGGLVGSHVWVNATLNLSISGKELDC